MKSIPCSSLAVLLSPSPTPWGKVPLEVCSQAWGTVLCSLAPGRGWEGSDWYLRIRLQGGVSSLAAPPCQVPTVPSLPSCYQLLGSGSDLMPKSKVWGSGPAPGIHKEQQPGDSSPNGSSALPVLCALYSSSLSSSPEKLVCEAQQALPLPRLFLRDPENQSPRSKAEHSCSTVFTGPRSTLPCLISDSSHLVPLRTRMSVP